MHSGLDSKLNNLRLRLQLEGNLKKASPKEEI